MMAENFDRTDRASIFKYSTGLIDHCLREFANEEEILQLPAGDKGKLGKLVEYLYFKYPINNNPEADFAEAGMELKCTGLRNIHTRIVLSPLNPEFQPIVLEAGKAVEGEFQIYGELIHVIPQDI